MGTPALDPKVWTLARRLRSFRDAFAGVGAMFATEPHAWVHLVATIVVVILALWLGIGAAGWIALVLAMALVWVAEAFNTALESLADATAPDPHPLVGRAKDAAAGAVLLAAMASVAVGLLVLGPPLWARLFGG